MMYALGDMEEVICLAGALCKTWALLFTGEFGARNVGNPDWNRLTHVRGEVWGIQYRADVLESTYPRVQRSL